MSYILEALRRAQAERERQAVPGLQAQPYADLPAPAPPRRSLALAVAGGALLGVMILAGLWWWSTAADRPALAAGLPAATLPASTAAALPAPVAAPAPQTRLPVVVSAPVEAAVQASAPALPASIPAPAVAAAPVPVAPPTATAPPAGPRVVRLAQLPAEQRRELPSLTVGGSVWSDSAASRFVILDGQLLREGDPVAPGLVLERIAPKLAWLRWRDLRIELAL
jgi:general secretion pathway protein B